MHGIRHAIHSQFKGIVEAVTPAASVSHFEDKRVLTPEEFVIAGDHLVSTVGSWSWSSSIGKPPIPYLPPEKQFLVTRNVPCKKRATSLAVEDFEVEGVDACSEKWIFATANDPAGDSAVAASLGDLDDGDETLRDTRAGYSAEILNMGGANIQDTYIPPTSSAERRSYDLYITYSKFYQVPQFWLVGFSADKTPLSVQQMEADVSADHMRATVTVDPFPHIDKLTTMSIHPCQHAKTMKVFGDQQVANGKEFPVAHYHILFLKFISGVVPTIEYDYSMEYSMS